jgi:hypothetical protein
MAAEPPTRAMGGWGRGQVGAAGMSAALHLTPFVSAELVLGPVDVLKLSPLLSGRGGGGGGGGGSRGGRQRYPGLGLVRWDVRVGTWGTAWGPFLQSLEVGIVAAATSPVMTTCRDTVARLKDCTSYCTLFRDLEGCCSYLRDIQYRTADGGWLIECYLNSSPCDVSDLLMTTTMIGGGRGGGGGTTLTANGEDCECDNKCGNDDNNNHGSLLLLLFMLEWDLLLETPAMMDVGIICPRVSLQSPPSSPPLLLSSSCQSVLPLLAPPSSSPTSSILTSVLKDTSSTFQHGQRTRRSLVAPD